MAEVNKMNSLRFLPALMAAALICVALAAGLLVLDAMSSGAGHARETNELLALSQRIPLEADAALAGAANGFETLERSRTRFAALAAALGADELAVLFGSGALALLQRRSTAAAAVSPLPLLAVASASSGASTVTLSGLFLVFAKIGAVLFGSGYVLLAFLRADLVERLGWLSEAQLIDAIAVGQVTPGPVFTTATFIGYVLSGVPGALVATAGIFFPAFAFVALSGPLVPRLRQSPAAGAFLDGVNVASLALMAVVTVQLAHAALVDPLTVGIAAGSLLVLLHRINATWLVLGGAALGWASNALR